MHRALFISWVPHHARSEALARELGAEAVFLAVGRTGHRPSAPLRYVAQALWTVAVLARLRPTSVIVMAPPNLLVRILLLWRWMSRGVVVVDAHSDAVLHRRDARTRQPFARLARQANAVIVTNAFLAERLAGARTLVLGDPPTTEQSAVQDSDVPSVVFPASWGFDEPIEWIVRAAEALPTVQFVITGRPDRSRLLEPLPKNLEVTGFLDAEHYDKVLRAASVVLALTTRPETLQRSAYDALDRRIPLVVSDTRVLRELLGGAALYVGTESDLVARTSQALAELGQLTQASAAVQARRWVEHRDVMHELRRVLGEQ